MHVLTSKNKKGQMKQIKEYEYVMTNDHVGIDGHNQKKNIRGRIKTGNPRLKYYMWASIHVSRIIYGQYLHTQ